MADTKEPAAPAPQIKTTVIGGSGASSGGGSGGAAAARASVAVADQKSVAPSVSPPNKVRGFWSYLFVISSVVDCAMSFAAGRLVGAANERSVSVGNRNAITL